MARKRYVYSALIAALALAVLVGGFAVFRAQPRGNQASVRQAATGCPAWQTPPAANIPSLPATASARQVAEQNAARVLQTPRPLRNLYQIIPRLTRGQSQTVACRVRSAPRNEKAGHIASFNIVNATQSGYHTIGARLVYVTAHVYMYADVNGGTALNDAALRASADRFEGSTYARDRAYYGEPWAAGPDDDPHITVLSSPEIPYGGYFSSEDEFPRAVSPFSNERQMIYIHVGPGLEPGTEPYDETLAHEFQHMIHWYWHPSDPSWANEGMSVLAQHVNGFSTAPFDATFLQQPGTMLSGWTDDQAANVPRYGAGYLFMDYFAEHYGGYAVLKELLASPQQTPLNFDAVLAAHGYKDRFDDVFARFVVANALNDPQVAGGIYAHPTVPGEKAVPQHQVTRFPYSTDAGGQPATTQQYAAQYFDFTPPARTHTLAVHLHGDPTVGIVANTPFGGAPAEWWSNSGDNLDSTLTRAFDLRALAGKRATLSFEAWYDLEQDFDYGYVEVSTDGGATWAPLRATSSVESNPNGANYGHGLTGTSGDGPAAAWVAERADLSAYAGKQILVRFETITDDAVHLPGLALDDIRIPELGFADTVATDGGWQAAGWLRSNNVLPEQYVLQAVVWTAGQAQPSVQRIAVDDATGTAHVTFADFGGRGTRVLLVLSALAPATIVPVTYHLSASLT